MATFQIPQDNLPRFEKNLAKLNKKARRLGVQELTYKTTRIHKELVEVNGVRHTVVYADVEVTGPAPKAGGWTFVGTIEALEGEAFLRATPGEVIPPEYHNADPTHCDHCNARRKRNETFIIRNDAFETKQVGRQCLADFLGHDVSEVLAGTRLMLELGEMAKESMDFLGGGRTYVELEVFLAYTAVAIREFGWVSKSTAYTEGIRSTASIAEELLFDKNNVAYRPTEEDFELARKAIEWAERFIDREENNDYEHNVGVLAKVGAIGAKQFGVAASIIFAYQRAVEREAARKAVRNSEWVGTIGKRQDFEVTFLGQSEFASDFGWTYVYRFSDKSGNMLVWKSGSAVEFEQGKEYKVKATPKAHNEYRGTKQTLVNRLVVVK